MRVIITVIPKAIIIHIPNLISFMGFMRSHAGCIEMRQNRGSIHANNYRHFYLAQLFFHAAGRHFFVFNAH